ncbi:MAG: hypothetical protein ABH828_01860 [archaeon]
MLRKSLIILAILMLMLTSCQYLKSDEESMITGEVIEILPTDKGDTSLDDKYSDILIRVEGVEGDLMELKPTAYDPDGDIIAYTFSEPFDEDGNWQTKEGDAGKYVVKVTASDGKLFTSEDILIIISPMNKAPVIDCPEKLSFKESDLIKLPCDISDPEGSDLEIEYSGWMNSDKFQTDFKDAGEYIVTVTASDGERTTTKTINIVVENLNRAPIVEGLKDLTVEETDMVKLDFEAKDPDFDDLTYEYSEPFDENGEWITNFGDTGNYEAYVVVSDGMSTVKSEFTVVVKQKNTMPSLEFIEPITVDEGDTITLPINAFDREGDLLEVTISGWFNTKEYTTNFDDAGEHIVTVSVSDGELTKSQDVEITVVDMNRPPVFKIPA